jgi:hypothetical protein
MLSVAMLSVVMVSVVILNAVALVKLLWQKLYSVGHFNWPGLCARIS